jgi:hypothetical protein
MRPRLVVILYFTVLHAWSAVYLLVRGGHDLGHGVQAAAPHQTLYNHANLKEGLKSRTV